MKRLLLAALCVSACVDVADERARRDGRIGRESSAGLEIEVQDGLAHVRELSAGALTLWAQAPAWQARLRAAESGEWQVTIRNGMPDGRVCLDDTCLSPDAVRLPTERTWRLSLRGGEDHVLRVAPPDADAVGPLRFVVYADVQGHIGSVQDIYRSMAEQPGVRFGLISGDLTEEGTPAQQRRFQREMETLPFPCFATVGNHDLGDGDDVFQRYYGRVNFSFAFRGTRVTLLDSASATLAPRVYGWLDGWLDTPEKTHLALMHIPPLDPVGARGGGFASRAEAMKIVSTLARGGVDLTVYGHVHSYYHFRNAGIDAHITGGGGAIPERLDGIGRHYLVVDADPVAGRFSTRVERVSPAD